MKRFPRVVVCWPVFWAAVQVVVAVLLFTVVSILLRWPANLLPAFYLMTSAVCYGLVVWASRGEGR